MIGIQGTSRPTSGARKATGLGLYTILARYGLLALLVALTAAFSILLPSTFPTLFNLRTTLETQTITLLVALGLMVPFAAGVFDLSIGFVVGLALMLSIGLQVNQHLSWPAAVVVVFVVAAILGLINGLLVTRVKVESLIATLGSGSIVYGITLAYSDQPVIGHLPNVFVQLTRPGLLTIPWCAWFALIVTLALWFLLEYSPVGRRLYVVGANRRAAVLAGISVDAYIQLSFVISALLGAAAGILLASSLQVAEPTAGPEYLLPGFSAAFLGTAVIKPGRLNPRGTVIAVFILAVTLSGLLQLGVPGYVQNFFNGTMLIAAMALAGFSARHRITRGGRAVDEQSSNAPEVPAADKEGVAESR